MDRRGFIGSILALGAAPAIVRAGSLMPVVDRIGSAYEIITINPVGPIVCASEYEWPVWNDEWPVWNGTILSSNNSWWRSGVLAAPNEEKDKIIIVELQDQWSALARSCAVAIPE